VERRDLVRLPVEAFAWAGFFVVNLDKNYYAVLGTNILHS
jgi:hypothetical protein